MYKTLKAHIEYLLCIRIERTAPIYGGDISKGFLPATGTERFFSKINLNTSALAMFLVEKSGLVAIAKTKTIASLKCFFTKNGNQAVFS